MLVTFSAKQNYQYVLVQFQGLFSATAFVNKVHNLFKL